MDEIIFGGPSEEPPLKMKPKQFDTELSPPALDGSPKGVQQLPSPQKLAHLSEPDEEPHPSAAARQQPVACCSALQGLVALVRELQGAPAYRRLCYSAPQHAQCHAPRAMLGSSQLGDKIQLQAEQKIEKGKDKQAGNKTRLQTPQGEQALSGTWVQTRFTGDMEQLMLDAGVPWAVRRLAKSLDYGNGKTFTTISQAGDSVEIILEMPTKAPTKQNFTVGLPDYQETVGGADTKPMLVKASWDGHILVLERRSLSGKTLPTVLRWIDSECGELVEEVTTSKGGKVLRYFKKQ